MTETTEAVAIIEQANSLVVENAASEEQASEILITVKSLRKEVKKKFGPAVKATHAAWKEAKAIEKSYDDPLKDAEASLKGAISDYRLIEYKRLQEEQRKVEEAARNKAEAERKAEIEKLKQEGNQVAATVQAHVPVKVEPVPEVKAAPKPNSIQTREAWSASVIDINKVPIEYLIPDMQLLNKIAKEQKGNMNIPGVESVMKLVVASKSSMPTARPVEVTEF